MRFVMKHLSKKTLSVILALMVLLSTVAVAFSALADPAQDPFVVTLARPAIPMQVGKTLDLNSISVQFAENEVVTGDQIVWSTEETAVLLDSTSGYLTTFAQGVFALKATKVGTTQHKTVYAVVNLDGAATYKIYDYTFTANDINAEGNNFKADSEWDLVPYSTLENGQFVVNGQGLSADNNHVNFVLKPNSASGKLISAFRDITVDAELAFPTLFTQYGSNFILGVRAQFANNTPAYSSTSYTGGGYRAALTIQTSGAGHKDYAVTYVSGKSKKIEFTQANNSTEYNTYTIKSIGETVELYKNGVKADLPMTADQQSAIASTQGGTIFFTSANTVRASLKRITASITFTAEELAKISYIDYYFIIPQNKPAIPVSLNSKVVLDRTVIEFADGTYMLGSDVVWENNNGAIAYDDATNSFSIYASGMFTVKAKKNAADAGTEIYLVTPDANGLYTIYEHTFSADDLVKPTGHNGKVAIYNPNSNYFWGTWMATYSNASDRNVENPNSDWALRNESVALNYGKEQEMFELRDEINPAYPKLRDNAQDCKYWSLGVTENITAEDITANSFWTFTANKGLHIASNQPSWIYLKPDSEGGKLIGRFSDYTIDYTYVTNLTNANYTIPVLGRFSGNTTEYAVGKNIFTLANEQYLGAYIPHGKSTYTGVSIAYGNTSKKDSATSYKIDGGEYTAKIKLSGNNVTVSMKRSGEDSFTQLCSTTADIDVSSLRGTIAIRQLNETRQYNKAISVSIDYSAEELAKLQSSPVAELYNLTQNFPAVPMKKATMLDLSKVLVELPNGDFTTGDKLDWSTTYVGSNFFIDNTAKTAYAYGSGRYDVTVKNGSEIAANVHFVIADEDGVYKIFEHTFTQADLDALSTGVSDMWISTRHVNSASTASYVNEVNALKDYSTDAKKDGNADFDEEKGLSIYTNEDRLIILNPAHSEAKVVSKFRDYSIGFTATKRTANNQGHAGDFYGYIGAVGRIDFGTDGIFQFVSSQYNVSDVSDATKNLQLDHKFYGAIYLSSTLGTTYYATTEGWRQDNNLRQVNPYPGRPSMNTYAIDVTKPYNYRISFKGRDVAMSVAPYGTASFTTLYDSALDTAVKDAYLADPNSGIGRFYLPLDSSNTKSGTIALYYGGGSRAYYKDLYVAIEFEKLPELTSLGECRDTESRLLYLQVGQVLDVTQINFEEGDRYYNGSLLTFAPVAGLTIVNGEYIKPDAEGVYNVTANTGSGSFTLTIAVSAAGSLFDNGNYTFTHSGGVITSYIRKDTNNPFSQHVKFLANIDGNNIYELGAGLAGASAGNKEVVSIELEKFIEKVGAGAFIGAANLEKVTLSNTVTEIGDSAFGGTAKLESIVLPGSVEKIGAKAFESSGLTKVIISNKDAVIGEKAFPTATVIYGFAGSTAEAYATANGNAFVALSGAEKTAAEASYNEWTAFKAERLTKVNNAEYIIHKQNDYGKITYYINGFKVTDRTAGKFVIPATVKVVENGETKTVKIAGIRGGENRTSPFDTADGRAIYTLEFEEGIASIGFHGFKNCYNIQSVTFPSSMNAIGWEAFAGTALTTVTIPDTMRTIGPQAFNNCLNLTEVKISENSMLQAVGTHSVRPTESPEGIVNGTKVTKIVLPVTVERITSGSFNLSNVRELWIYNKDLQFIDTYSNDNKDGYVLPTGTVIYGVKGSTAEEYATKWNHTFHEIPDFYTTHAGVADATAKFGASFDGTNYIVGSFMGIGGKVVMPSVIDVGDVKNAPITVIPSTAFQFDDVPTNGIDRIINLEIDEGYVEIAEKAFKNTDRLKSIKLPTTLRKIGKMAFSSSGLEGTLEVPKGVTEIGAAAFRGLKGVTDIYIYNAGVTIGANAFDATVTIHGVAGSAVEAYATENNIKFVAIEKTSTTTSDFSDNGNYTFTVENGIITGYERKDANKPYSMKVSIPAEIGGVKITGIGEGIFEAGAEANSVLAVDIAKGITEIGARAFQNAVNLGYITLPEGLKTIGDSAFVGTSLTGNITIPASTETIGANAFKGCLDIDTMKVESKTVSIKANALPRGGQKTVILGYTGSTAEEYCTTYKVKFEYLDGGPEKEPDEPAGEDKPEDEDTDYTGDPITPPDDSQGAQDTIIYVGGASDLTLIIVIAVSILLLVLLLAVAVVVVVVVKSKRDSIY